MTNNTNGQTGGDNVIQQSFLYQIYQPTPGYLVGPNVVVFNGAFGQQTLPRWDPYDGFYSTGGCDFPGLSEQDAECNYDRVENQLTANNFTEAQVQAIFIKAADPYPQCDLKRIYCTVSTQPDAYSAEHFLGDILRYLRCCRLGTPQPVSRYQNLQQVFITSRTYGGYANGILETDGKTPIPGAANCLNPEPFAYESAFAVQRAIVAQINATADPYSGDLHFNPTPNQQSGAPWFDWGPYLWASGTTPNGAGLFWCDSTTTNQRICQVPVLDQGDFRYGDLTITSNNQYAGYFGDHTHPTAAGAAKVANQLVNWMQGGSNLGSQAFISGWVTPWLPAKR